MNNLNDGQLAKQARLIKEGSGREIIDFVLNHIGYNLDVTGLQNRILEVGFENHIWYFAIDAVGADIEALQNCILSLAEDRKSTRAVYITKFALIPGASIDRCEAKVLEEGTAEECFYFALGVPSANVVALHDRATRVGFDRRSDTWMEDEDSFKVLREYYLVNEAALSRK